MFSLIEMSSLHCSLWWSVRMMHSSNIMDVCYEFHWILKQFFTEKKYILSRWRFEHCRITSYQFYWSCQLFWVKFRLIRIPARYKTFSEFVELFKPDKVYGSFRYRKNKRSLIVLRPLMFVYGLSGRSLPCRLKTVKHLQQNAANASCHYQLFSRIFHI